MICWVLWIICCIRLSLRRVRVWFSRERWCVVRGRVNKLVFVLWFEIVCWCVMCLSKLIVFWLCCWLLVVDWVRVRFITRDRSEIFCAETGRRFEVIGLLICCNCIINVSWLLLWFICWKVLVCDLCEVWVLLLLCWFFVVRCRFWSFCCRVRLDSRWFCCECVSIWWWWI